MMTTSNTERFSAHYFDRLQYNWVDFLFQIRSRNFDTAWLGFVSYLRDIFRIPFKPQKGTPIRWLLYLHAKCHPIPSSGFTL